MLEIKKRALEGEHPPMPDKRPKFGKESIMFSDLLLFPDDKYNVRQLLQTDNPELEKMPLEKVDKFLYEFFGVKVMVSKVKRVSSNGDKTDLYISFTFFS